MRKETILISGLIAFSFLSRIPFRSKIPYGLDSIQFVLALDNFDVRLHQPHPPGYFLYVMLGRLYSLFFKDANQCFLAVNILFSTFSILVIYRLGRSLYGTSSGLFSSLLLATSSLFWFHGEVALSNAVDCFFACLVAWLCWKTLNGEPQALYYSALALGLSGGVRQNSLVFLMPLWIFSLARSGIKKQLTALLLLGATTASWYLPMAARSGGIHVYQTALRDHWFTSGWHGFTLVWIPFNFLCVSYFILLGTGLGFLFVLFGMLFWMEDWRHHIRENPKRFLFLTLWLAPSLAFFVFVYSHPAQTGHSLIYLPALLLLLPKWVQITCLKVSRLWKPTISVADGKKGRKGGAQDQSVGDPVRTLETWPAVVSITIAVLAIANCLTFLGMNTAVSRARIIDYEAQVADMAVSIRAQCPPDQTILVSADFMFLGFRDMMYHLPEYHTFQPRLYTMAGRPLLFSGYQCQTQLVEYVEIPTQVRYFVLNADEFTKNPGLIQGLNPGKVPEDHLLKTQTRVRWYRGKVQELPEHFPGIHFVFNGKTGSNDTFGAGVLALPLN